MTFQGQIVSAIRFEGDDGKGVIEIEAGDGVVITVVDTEDGQKITIGLV